MEPIKELKDLREKAEAAVADMPIGDLRTKAFEVILQHLLSTRSATNIVVPPTEHEKGRRKTASSHSSVTTKSRILLLKNEGFFKNPRTFAEIKDELKAHGWYIDRTSLSNPLLRLVRELHLRRIKEKVGNTKVWKYVNR